MDFSKLMENMFDNLGVGIAAMADSKVVYMNLEFARIFGFEKVEEMPPVFSDLFLPEYEAIAEEHYKTDSEKEYRVRTHTKTGEIKTISITGRTKYLENKKMRVITVSDVSAENELESRLEFFYENTNEAIILIKDDVIVDCNRKFEVLSRMKREEFINIAAREAGFGVDFEVFSELEKNDEVNNLITEIDSEWGKMAILINASTKVIEGEKHKIISILDVTDRVRLEREMNLIVKNLDGAVLRVDPEGFYTFAEGSLLSQFEVGSSDIVGKHYEDYLRPYPDSVDAVRLALTGTKNEIEYDREGRYYVAKHVPHIENDGRFSVITMLSEITDQKKTTERLRMILENFDGAIYKLDKDGRFEFYKGKTLGKLGYTKEDVIGAHFEKFIRRYPESIRNIKNAYRGIPSSYEFERYGAYYRVSHIPHIEDDGSKTVYGILYEVTEMREAEEKLEILMRNFGGSINKITADGIYTFADGSLLEEFGTQSEDIVGRHYQEYLKDFPDSQKCIEDALKGIKGASEFILNGQHYHVNYIPFRERDESYSVVSLMANITDVKTLSDRLDFLMKHLDGTIFRIDSDEKFSVSEGRLLNAFNLKPNDLIGKSYREHFKKDPGRINAIEKAFAGEKTIMEFRRNGRAFLASHIPFEENGQISVAGITSEITDLRKVTDKMDYLLSHFDGSIYKLDSDGKFSISEGALLSIFGKKPGELVGMHYEEFLMDFPEHIKAVEMAYAGEKNVNYFDMDQGHYMVSHIPMVEEDGSMSVGGLMTDVTSLRRLQDELALERNYLKTTFESIDEGLVTLDPSGKLLFINETARRVLGYGGNGSGDSFKDILVELLGDDYTDETDSEGYHTNSNGITYYVNYSYRGVHEGEEHKGYILVIRDLTDKKKREEELLILTRYDHLTGIRNRRNLENVIQKYEKAGTYPLSVIIGDINGLKDVNDMYGHEEGDKLLLEFSKFFKNALDDIEVVGRWGGDEFLAILPNVDYGIAQVKVENMKRKLKRGAKGLEHVGSANISFGFAAKDFGSQSVMEVISKAETSMFGEKLFNESSIHHHLLDTMLNSLYEKSDETNAHCQRLNNYCQKIALRMNLSHDQKRELHLVSLLHDIGKLGIPDRVLNSTEKLTDEDWNYIKKHPEIGFRLLNTSKEMAPIANYVLQHHEKFDGTGYPNGVRGYDIPLVVRIITIVDSFDAMVSKRVYKDKMTMEDAIEEIKRCKGSHFDPDIADLFIGIIEEEKGL